MLMTWFRDTSYDLKESCRLFAEQHPSSHKPTTTDMALFRDLAASVSVRSSALVATCVFTLWDYRLETQTAYCNSLPKSSAARQTAEADLTLGKTMVSFNGSVLENYTGYLPNCQQYLNQLVESQGFTERGGIELVPAKESSLQGAAVALACLDGEA
jgi:hexokinase